MLILCTDAIQVDPVGERMRVTFPSGSDSVVIDLSLNQALMLGEATRRATSKAMVDGFASAPATLLRFPKPRKARRV
ncbi:hypothetical protein J2W40_002191 [Sphingobium xenophagum]|uniref:Uncharacterized protein n=1 Tax=Sphingobium xenophagum TaxID=121428 RepID=A0ABU1X256_SPHXE|nr:hypothetical protein [Sphingobium xenophagum]MDR7155364.1 hypothetical protein [Sphingobium xenophagum]